MGLRATPQPSLLEGSLYGAQSHRSTGQPPMCGANKVTATSAVGKQTSHMAKV